MKRGVTYAELEAATTFTVKKNLKNNNGTNSSSSTSRDLSKIGGVDIMQNQFYLQRAKQELFLKLSGKSKSSSLGYLSRVGVDIRSRLDMAFTQCMSTSLLVVGPTGSGKKSIIDHVLRSYQNSDGITPFAVARVQAQVCPTDQDALCSIAGQLCVRNSAGRNVVAALEDLEDHFRQCAMNSQPSVVVLEDVHNFATREKQVLIYTLLDYMHKPDMLFVVIGCTPCAHLQYMLEKRVLSRLNAQFVYVAPASGVEVCGALAEKLSLETTSIIDVAERAFRESFNSEVAALLGPKQSDECSTISKESVWTDKSRLKKNGASRFPPLLLNTISRYTEWGKGLDYFIRVAQLAVVELNATQYMFTQKSWERALYSQEPYTLAERLSALPLHELHLFASVARCYARIGLVQAGGNSHSNTYKSRRDPTVNVGEVLDELDRLTGALRRRESTFAGSLQGLLFLVREGLILLLAGNKSTPARVVTNQTIIIMLPPSYEIYEAFQATLEPDLECIGRERFSLMVSDRVRRAVLEPAETPIAIADRL